MTGWADRPRPTDGAYAFALRPVDAVAPALPPPGQRTHVDDVARRALGDEAAARFAARVTRWGGPEDVAADGTRPYTSPQVTFVERSPERPFDAGALEDVLAGEVAVVRVPGGPTDYVLRDHHVLDVVLYHYVTTGRLPRALFHADRHSDWCTDAYLEARVPAQAATWWALLPGLKRPDGTPALDDTAVTFTTAAPPVALAGRDVGASARVPWFVDRAALPWERALDHAGADWLSLDLDLFQPLAQWRLTRGMLRDPRLHGALAAAEVRLFVVSPQFTSGGDVVEPWVVRGSRGTSLRLLRLLRSG